MKRKKKVKRYACFALCLFNSQLMLMSGYLIALQEEDAEQFPVLTDEMERKVCLLLFLVMFS